MKSTTPAMETAIILSITLVNTVITAPIEYYDSAFDKLDGDHMWKDSTTLKMYTDCYLDKGPCDDIGGRIRKVIPECLETACARCTPKQKHTIRRYFEELVKQYPQEVEAFIKKYDPAQKYITSFLDVVKDA